MLTGMDRRPTVDPALRRKLLAEVRTSQIRTEAALSPSERLARVEQLLQYSRSMDPYDTSTHDPPELWLELLRRWRLLR
jgi:hypothetical protein